MTPEIDETHDPARSSWKPDANGHNDFPVQNLPFGIFSPPNGSPRPGVAIGNHVLDLRGIASLLDEAVVPALEGTTLNALFALPAPTRRALRRRLSILLSDPAYRSQVEPMLRDTSTCMSHLPMCIGDYTDFYVGIHHANNVGRQFRPDTPLLPNYKWVPIGYHGRASSVRPSGTPVIRPGGQRMSAAAMAPEFGPTERLDYELELGVWIAGGNRLGQPIPIREARRHVAGLCLLNDWSARDVQAWEYQPLGPFLSKSFHTTISPWIVTSEALAPFRMAQPARPENDPEPLSYLTDAEDKTEGAFAIDLTVALSSQAMRDCGLAPIVLSQSAAKHMYWTTAQIIAHHTSNGCNLNVGDLLGTGTISAPDPTGYGSLLETSMGGKEPILLPSGEKRAFLVDGDEVTLSGCARADGFVSIGFGPCAALVLPALA